MNNAEFIKQCKARQRAAVNALKSLEQEGVKLPMPAEEIYIIEARGDLVDLTTGEIIKGGASIRVAISDAGRQRLNAGQTNAKSARTSGRKGGAVTS